MTPEQLAECASGGQFWWMRPDGTFYGHDSDTPVDPSDIRLGDFSPVWVAQWESWEQAAEVMQAAGLFARLEELKG